MGIALFAARCALAAVFLRSGLAKVFGLADFRSAVENYEILPPPVVPAVALVLPFAEVAAAVLLACGVLTGVVSGLMAVLLVSFAAAIAINLARGRVFDCGCAGRTAPRLITWTHVRLNAALAVAAAAVALAPPTVLAAWPGPTLFAVTMPGDDALPVVLAVLAGLVTAAVVRAAARQSGLTRTLRERLGPPPAAPGLADQAPGRMAG